MAISAALMRRVSSPTSSLEAFRAICSALISTSWAITSTRVAISVILSSAASSSSFWLRRSAVNRFFVMVVSMISPAITSTAVVDSLASFTVT